MTRTPIPDYHLTIRELPHDERPRERIARYGPSTLQTAELLALILRTGTAQDNVIALAQRSPTYHCPADVFTLLGMP